MTRTYCIFSYITQIEEMETVLNSNPTLVKAVRAIAKARHAMSHQCAGNRERTRRARARRDEFKTQQSGTMAKSRVSTAAAVNLRCGMQDWCVHSWLYHMKRMTDQYVYLGASRVNTDVTTDGKVCVCTERLRVGLYLPPVAFHRIPPAYI